MGIVFDNNNIGLKDPAAAISLYSEAINVAYDLFATAYFGEKYLQNKDPQKYKGDSVALLDSLKDLISVEQEFKNFVSIVELWQEEKYNLEETTPPEEVKNAVESFLNKDPQKAVDTLWQMSCNVATYLTNTTQKLASYCDDENYIRFNQFVSNHINTIGTYLHDNLIEVTLSNNSNIKK